MLSESANIARHLPAMAAAQPAAPALKVPRGRTAGGRIDYLTLSFADLEKEVGSWQALLDQRGVKPGDRVLVMVRQGLPLIASVFALFAAGAVPVVIDPGMGRKAFLSCVARSQPRVLLGIPAAHILSRVFRTAFRSVEIRVQASSRPTTRRATATGTLAARARVVASAATDLAAILFTSGSTGAPKGVCYEHGMFDAQVGLIRDTYGIAAGEVDLPMLPIFALFNPALGMTTIVPEIDPTRPAQVEPARIVQAIRQENVTNSFGSPTLWHKIAAYCHERQIQLPSLKRVLCAGAPVPPALWPTMANVMPHGELHSPYGATEALPVASVAAREIVIETAERTLAGAGTCVGRPLPANDVRIIALAEGLIRTMDDARELPAETIGEIIVAGPTVTRMYDNLPEATAKAKIRANAERRTSNAERRMAEADRSNLQRSVFEVQRSTFSDLVYHRMGDVGYLDASGRLWFCGRAAERVETSDGPLYTEQVEPLFNAHPLIRRCALIGLGPRGAQQPALVIEPREWKPFRTRAAQTRLAGELHLRAATHAHAARVHRFYFHRSLPVDVRHNAKIHRLTLAGWAATAPSIDLAPVAPEAS